ncbi:MAG: hypothetical protein JRE47_10115 [Deltaproteobacteria bacterium]|nr:hypothetical protein [Deltaproteobacteria bacterium]
MRKFKRGNWTDENCFYVSVKDGNQFNIVAGPFKTHKQALDLVEPAIKAGRILDPKSHFYAWGTVKMKNGHQEGILNKALNI